MTTQTPNGGAEEEVKVQVVRPVLAYMKHLHGERVIDEIANAVGIAREIIDFDGAWISLAQAADVLQLVRDRVESDDEFMTACSFNLVESVGPMVYLLRQASPKQVYKAVGRTSETFIRVARFRTEEVGSRSRIRITYESEVQETRLLCASRRAWMAALPGIWGLPKARVTEESCICWGDECCSYVFAWQEQFRWTRVLLATFAGLGLGAIGTATLGLSPLFVGLLGAGGTLAASVQQLRRMEAANMTYTRDANLAYEQLWDRYQSAMREILAQHRREREWTDQLEYAIDRRTSVLEDIVTELENIRSTERDTVKNVSQEALSPLTSLRLNSALLREMELPHPGNELAEDMSNAVTRMDALLTQLVRLGSDHPQPELNYTTINTSQLVDDLRRRLEALVVGRDIRTSVFRTREAPRQIVSEPAMLNRLLDLVLSHAARVTERGSIMLEVGGRPGFLCLKLLDTGRGMTSLELAARYDADRAPATQDGGGLQLDDDIEAAVKMLYQLDGRLEIMSRPDVGTTIWVYVPIDPAIPKKRRETDNDVVSRVVTIREAMN